jgi:hypothetical protein
VRRQDKRCLPPRCYQTSRCRNKSIISLSLLKTPRERVRVFYGIVIQMFWKDHSPPHFHALYAEYEALIDIRTLEVIQGHLPKSLFKIFFLPRER